MHKRCIIFIGEGAFSNLLFMLNFGKTIIFIINNHDYYFFTYILRLIPAES